MGALLVCFPRGQCSPPFHCSIVCSLSSSCLSEIWGGGCETKGRTHVRGKSRIAAAPMKCATNEAERFPHRVCLCRVVPHVNVGVIKGFFYRDAALGINDQHFGKQVPCLTRCYDNRGRAGLLWKQAYIEVFFMRTVYFPSRCGLTCLAMPRSALFYLVMSSLRFSFYIPAVLFV